MKVRLVSYNVKNLFAERDIKDSSGTKPKSERSLAALAESIDRLEGDVNCLQEVTSLETLQADLLSRRGLADKYPHVAMGQSNDGRGVNVAILSKYPFTQVVTHQDHPVPWADGSGEGRFSRDLLRADINLDQDPEADLTVYTTHSKSRRPADPDEINSDLRRLSEAKAIRQIVEQEMAPYPSRFFAVTGDLNDNTDDTSVQALLQPDSANPWLDSLDHLPADQRNTWPANPTHTNFPPEQFDHIIYSARFDGHIGEARPVRFEQSLDSDTRWVSSTASDHLPVITEVEIPTRG